MTEVGDACTVRFPKAGASPFFCQVHYAQGMEGVITVGSGGGSGPTTTAACPAGSNVCPGHHAKGGGAPVGRPAGHLLGRLGLFAVGALFALVLIVPLRALHPRASIARSASNMT
jgi:hypothetical protein